MPSQVTNVASDDALTAIYRMQCDEADEVIAARLAERLDVTAPSISAMLRRLERDQLIEIDGRKRVTLTESGLVRAESMIRRHRLAECFLVDTLGLEWWQAYEEAHLLEHAISPATEGLLRAHLGDPRVSPFGYPIPGLAEPAELSTRTVADLQDGESAEVERLFEEDQELLHFFDHAGLRPGTPVRMLRHEPARGIVELAVGEQVVGMGYPAARRIWVRTPQSHPSAARRARG